MPKLEERIKQEVNNHRIDEHRVDGINYNYNRAIVAICCFGLGFMVGYWL